MSTEIPNYGDDGTITAIDVCYDPSPLLKALAG
jgi:hypothetical protein